MKIEIISKSSQNCRDEVNCEIAKLALKIISLLNFLDFRAQYGIETILKHFFLLIATS